MLETIKIRKAGYPMRLLYKTFVSKFKPLVSKSKTDNIKAAAQEILVAGSISVTMFRFGSSKIFLKDVAVGGI
jgi:myosin heavy subunit